MRSSYFGFVDVNLDTNLFQILKPHPLQGGLFLGSQRVVQNDLIMKFNNIHTVVTTEVNSHVFIDSNKKMQHIVFEVPDNGMCRIDTFLDKVTALIYDHRCQLKNVVINCKTVRSVSPAFALAYMVRYEAYSYNEAYTLLKQKIPQINIYKEYQEQIQNFYLKCTQMADNIIMVKDPSGNECEIHKFLTKYNQQNKKKQIKENKSHQKVLKIRSKRIFSELTKQKPTLTEEKTKKNQLKNIKFIKLDKQLQKQTHNLKYTHNNQQFQIQIKKNRSQSNISSNKPSLSHYSDNKSTVNNLWYGKSLKKEVSQSTIQKFSEFQDPRNSAIQLKQVTKQNENRKSVIILSKSQAMLRQSKSQGNLEFIDQEDRNSVSKKDSILKKNSIISKNSITQKDSLLHKYQIFDRESILDSNIEQGKSQRIDSFFDNRKSSIINKTRLQNQNHIFNDLIKDLNRSLTEIEKIKKNVDIKVFDKSLFRQRYDVYKQSEDCFKLLDKNQER